MNKNAYKQLSIFLLVVLLVPLLSCCNNKIDDSKKRNILFYIGAGQSDIDRDAPVKINQIRAGWKPGNGEMIIYIDRVSQGACLLRVNEIRGDDGLYGLDTLDTYGVENSADYEVFSRVINDAVQAYPADSYGLIFFSHGSGWLPEGNLASPRSIVIDNNTGDGKTNREMEHDDFARAIPDKQFDFIILEACLMSDVMTMYELRNKAEYVLASSAEIVVPGFTLGDTYQNEIMSLYDTRSNVVSVLANFAKSYYDKESRHYNSATLSVIKMDEMENLASVTKRVLAGVEIHESGLVIGDIQTFDRPRVGGMSRSSYSRFFDLGHVVQNLVSDSDYRVFNAQMEKTVVWKISTNSFLPSQFGFSIKHHCGLTTYIKQDVYPGLNSFFENTSWYKAIY